MAATDSATVERWSRWVNTWTVGSLPGVCLAILDWGPGKVVATAATVALGVALVFGMVEHVRWEERTRTPGEAGKVVRWICRVVLCAVTFVVSMAAVIALVPGAALLLFGLAGATTPVVAGLRRKVLRQGKPRPLTHLEVAEPITPLQGSSDPAEAARGMTDAQLCCAWGRSFWTLREARDPLVKMVVVLQRQCLLDEFEARNAPALEAWLASGARPSASPERFFKDGQGDQPTAA